ncbi:hypothetical protein J2S59_001027 [Nocardioides massiliensis]|uniref:Glycosyltransferase RgtA/B/C/D-like domain-containing protein n=3 Tax=Nocardioides massiliensis TaxID=1325935 RepID=A0ABT9NLB9_9ACTN|nr:hypothetical protein [Nocardioides massiliensis]
MATVNWVSRLGGAVGVLVAAHLLIKVVVYAQVAHAPLIGDEAAYVDGARALSNLLRDLGSFTTPDVVELERNVVASGWFMPGMSLVLTPLFVLVPDAPVWAIRGFLGVVGTVLFLAVLRRVDRVWGRRATLVLMVFPGLVPTWSVFTFGAWGDQTAGVLLLLFLTLVHPVLLGAVAGRAPSIRQGLAIGAVAIACVYARSSVAVLVGLLGVLLAVAVVVLLRDAARRRAVVAAGVASAVFGGLLLPWSLSASAVLGDRVITTTSVSTVMANTFGDRDRVCFGPCDPGSTLWFSPLRYSREVARATGLSEVEVQQQMSAYARAEVTPRSYARDVTENAGRYALSPARFATYLRAPGTSDVVHAGIVVGTGVLFFPFLLAALVSLLVPRRRTTSAHLLAVCAKLSALALLSQPFVHIAGPRYWTTAAPVFALLALLLLRPSPMSDTPVGGGRLPGVLRGAEIAVAVFGTLVVGTLLVLAR